VRAECLFVDPVADIGVLGSPGGQKLQDQSEPYEALMETAIPLPIGEPAWQELELREMPRRGGARERIVLDYRAPARLLSLDGRLFRWTIGRSGNPAAHSIWIEAVEQPIGGGQLS
jgi:hypothetical protein